MIHRALFPIVFLGVFLATPVFAESTTVQQCVCTFQDANALKPRSETFTGTNWRMPSSDEVSEDLQTTCEQFCAYKATTNGSELKGSSYSRLEVEAFNGAKPVLGVPIPGFKGFTDPAVIDGVLYTNFIAEYLSAIYKWLVGAAAVFATIMMMVGGVQYMLAGGNAAGIDQAKGKITNALTGVVLLLASYLILYTVNPQLTIFKPLGVKIVKTIPLENRFEPSEGEDCGSGSTTGFKGVNEFQDCMLETYGDSKDAVENSLVSIKYKNRTYRVHEAMASDFSAALHDIDRANLDYNIARSTAGGTYNWRCNKNQQNALSAHSWGTAIDINPDTNPNCPKACTTGGTCRCVGGTSERSCESMCKDSSYDIPTEVITAFKTHGFTWGGDYTGAKDYMHFTYTAKCSGG